MLGVSDSGVRSRPVGVAPEQRGDHGPNLPMKTAWVA